MLEHYDHDHQHRLKRESALEREYDARDRKRRALTLRMSQKVAQAVHEHLPEYAQGASRRELNLPEGKKLREVLDALQLPPAETRKAKLSQSQKR